MYSNRASFFLVATWVLCIWSTLVHGLVQLRVSPLVGGPRWLPVHVKVVVCHDHVWDFLPLNPRSLETTRKLVFLKSVPGEIRYRYKTQEVEENQSPSEEEDAAPSVLKVQTKDDVSVEAKVVASAFAYADSYPDKLHLITNNCWTFALGLVWHLRRES